MLLAYDKGTGRVLWNSGTNSAYPDGPPDFVAYNATNTLVGLLRLNDKADAKLVAMVMSSPAVVKDGQVVIGGAPYTPSDDDDNNPVTPPLTLDERLSRIQSQIDQLMDLILLGSL
jgi:hypothetical protein